MTELNGLTLPIGAHVIAFPDSASWSVVNPEPATLLLLAMAAGTVGFCRKNRDGKTERLERGLSCYPALVLVGSLPSGPRMDNEPAKGSLALSKDAF